MFHQVEFAEWSVIVTTIAFVVSFSVFVTVVVGAIRFPREKMRELSALPLEEEKRS